MSNRYLSDSQLADRYSVNRATVWRWARTGRLAAPVKLSPGCTRWHIDSVTAFESSRQQRGAAKGVQS